jgi:segregation and condensation protein B
MRIQEVAGGFQMVTPAEMAVFLKKFYKERRLERLSKPALETLAIIAYKQPLTKQEVEVLRQVNVDGLLQGLLDKGLVRVVGRKKTPGRPKVYGTTREFLEYFGLKSLEELPKIENFQLGQGRVLAEPSAPAADSREERDAISQAAPEN